MNQQFSPWARALVVVLVSVGLSAAIGGCTTARIPATSLEVPLLDIPLPAMLRGQNDLRSRSWTKAFVILHERMKREYAYSAVKEMDWDALYTHYSSEVLAAEETKNRDAWYRALRGYVHSIPDGNVQIDLNESLRAMEEGASAGLALAQLADGQVIVSGLVPDGPAAAAGMAWGAEVLAWNDKPILEALESTSLFWTDAPAATLSVRREQQLTWLPRGAAGEACRVVFKNPGAAAETSVTVKLAPDDYKTLSLYRPLWSPVELFSSPVVSRSIGDDLHYIRLAAIAPTLSTPFPQRDFRNAVRAAIDGEAAGLVLDLRGTQGGDATLVPKLLGCLVEEASFYEMPGIWNATQETFVADPAGAITLAPQVPFYTGPLVVLVDGYTMGPAESFARFLQARENVRVCGLSGTYGSPGVPSVELTLPGGYVIYYPDRQALDEAGVAMGVANRAGEGNVTPDLAVALDAFTAAAIYQDGEDKVLEAALEALGN